MEGGIVGAAPNSLIVERMALFSILGKLWLGRLMVMTITWNGVAWRCFCFDDGSTLRPRQTGKQPVSRSHRLAGFGGEGGKIHTA